MISSHQALIFRFWFEVFGVEFLKPNFKFVIVDYEDQRVVENILFVEDIQTLTSLPMEDQEKITEDVLKDIYHEESNQPLEVYHFPFDD